MPSAAFGTGVQGGIAVEALEERRQVVHDADQLHLGAMHQVVALQAVPLEGVLLALGSLRLDHQPDASGHGTLRGVPDVCGQEEDVALPDGNVPRRLSRLLHDAQHHVALQLVEELLHRVVMEVGAVVGAAHHRDHQFSILPNLGVAHGRLESASVLFNPVLKIEGAQFQL